MKSTPEKVLGELFIHLSQLVAYFGNEVRIEAFLVWRQKVNGCTSMGEKLHNAQAIITYYDGLYALRLVDKAGGYIIALKRDATPTNERITRLNSELAIARDAYKFGNGHQAVEVAYKICKEISSSFQMKKKHRSPNSK
jgi:hypothetical protein